MVFIVKNSPLYSRATGKHYNSMRAYEKALESEGSRILSEKEYQLKKEELNDTIHSKPKEQKVYNHVNINLATGKDEFSYKAIK